MFLDEKGTSNTAAADAVVCDTTVAVSSKEFHKPCHCCSQIVTSYPLPCFTNERLTRSQIGIEDLLSFRRKPGNIAGGHDELLERRRRDLAYAADIACDIGNAGGHGLEQDMREALFFGG